MTYAELARALRRHGCELKRQSKGSHEIWRNPRTNAIAVVPRHRSDLPTGTLHRLLKDLGLTLEDLA